MAVDPAPSSPQPSKPNPNPGRPGRQPDKPTPEPPKNPGPKPTPNPNPTTYNPSDPSPKPQDPATKPSPTENKSPYPTPVRGGGTNPIPDPPITKIAPPIKPDPPIKDDKDKVIDFKPFPIDFIPPIPINNPDPIPTLKNSTPVNRNTGEVIEPKPDPQPAKEEPKVGTPGSGGSTCLYPGYHPAVMGGHQATQKTVGAVNTLITTKTNVAVNFVKETVTKSGELLGKIVRSDVVDRAINLLTLASAIHNSVMLSRDLGSTLTEALSNILSAVGIKDAEGNAFNLGDALGTQLQTLIISIVGAENYATYKQVWIESNRILTTADNLLNAVKAEHSAIMEGVEVVANITSELSNASKLEGLFNDDLLDFQPTQHDFKTPFGKTQLFLQNLNEAGEQINQLASAVIEGQEAKAEIEKNWTEMNTAISKAKTLKRTLETTKDGQNIPPDSELLDFVRHQAEEP